MTEVKYIQQPRRHINAAYGHGSDSHSELGGRVASLFLIVLEQRTRVTFVYGPLVFPLLDSLHEDGDFRRV